MKTINVYEVEDLEKALEHFSADEAVPVMPSETAADIARECIKSEIKRRKDWMEMFEPTPFQKSKDFQEGFNKGWQNGTEQILEALRRQ